jgi:exodeoxyribonuclease V gamma subunit
VASAESQKKTGDQRVLIRSSFSGVLVYRASDFPALRKSVFQILRRSQRCLPLRTLFSMSPRLHVSAHASELLQQLRNALAQAQRESVAVATGVPKKIPVLVAHAQLGDWLQTRLARELGLSMGFDFPQPAAFFRRQLGNGEAAACFAEASAFWSREQLAWHLLSRIDPVARRLGHDAHQPVEPRTRFAFARLLAATFDRYARQRPDWPARWTRNQAVSETDDEAWQRELWRDVAEAAPLHPAQLLQDLARSASDRTAPPIFAVLTDSIDPFTLQALAALAAAGRTVSLHVLLPSLGFLGDVARRKSMLARAAAPTDETEREGTHPLIVSLGQEAVGTFLLLGQVTPDYAEWPEPTYANEVDDVSLLATLQADIRSDVLPAGAPRGHGKADTRREWDSRDRSLTVHSCHSPRRELEVLRDELLRAFQDLRDLKPEDVLIAVPDLDVYASLAEGVLKSGAQPLPVRLTAIAAREANPVAAGVLALLDLSLGQGGASELIELLNLPALQRKLDITGDAAAAGQLASLIRNSGLTSDADVTQRSWPDDTGTWRFALDRLIAGKWFGPIDAADDAVGNALFPVAAELHGDEELQARFLSWITEVAVQLEHWRSHAPAREWSRRLIRAADTLFYSDELDDHAAAFRRLLGQLAMVDADTPLDAATLKDWLEAQLENATSLRTSVGGEILFGRLEQLHGLPCRVLAILGLQHGAFPRSGVRPPWDLLARAPRRWDNDPRTHDRQLFLDSVLAPADRLILTAANRSVRSGHDGPLSACVEELLRVAGETFRGAANIVVAHRVQPFAADYFAAENSQRSYDASAAQIATDLRRPRDESAPPFFSVTHLDVAPLTDPVVLTLEELIGFWKNPAKAWLRRMQVELPRDERDDSELDQSPLVMNPLEEYGLGREIVERVVAGAGLARVAARRSADRVLPPGAIGRLVWSDRHRNLLPLGEALRLERRATAQLPVSLDLGGVRLTGSVEWIPAQGRTFSFHVGDIQSPKQAIAAFITMLTAAVQRGEPTGARVLGRDVNPAENLATYSATIARPLLETLIAGWIAGRSRPLCFAPRTSREIADKLAKTANADDALQKGRREWLEGAYGGPGGEGAEPPAAFAWRDADAFAAPFDEDWLTWARGVAAPLQEWWNTLGVPA